MKQNLGVVPREYPLSYVVIPMSVLVKYGQTMEWKARTHPRPRSEHIMLICRTIPDPTIPDPIPDPAPKPPSPSSPPRSRRVLSYRRGIRNHRTHQGRIRIFHRYHRAHRSLNSIICLLAADQWRR